MKSSTRIVLSSTLTAATSYTSGPLDVGDLEQLLVTAPATAIVGTTSLSVSSVDANGNLIKIATLVPTLTSNTAVVCIGNSSTYEVNGTNAGIPYFGDQIQIDLTTTGSLTAQISVKGK